MPTTYSVFIVFGKRRNPFLILSTLIRWVNKTPYSHCGVLVSSFNGGIVYESTMPKSKCTAYADWLKHYKLMDIVEVTTEKNPTEFLDTLLGVNYSYTQLLFIALKILIHPIFKYFTPNTINGMKELVCAEFVACFLEEFTTARFIENDFVTLSDVNKAAKDLANGTS